MNPRPRGRPRAYDPDAALEAALATFWERGFAATSLDDLREATGMNRPSLYAAFGDKKTIYRLAIERFRQRLRADIGAALADAPSLETALARYFRTTLRAYRVGTPGARGCPAICTAAVEAAHDEEIRHDLADILAEIEHGLTGVFARAKSTKEVPPSADARLLGQLAAAIHHSLAIRARAGASEWELKAFIGNAVKAVSAMAKDGNPAASPG
jgi:AcrR family transcriptional regulator